MDIDSERKAFEVDLTQISRMRSDDGEYLDINVEHDWRVWHQAWQARAALVAPQQEPVAPNAELESMTRMFHAACEDLGAISEVLGLDPDDGGAEPIIDAIEELKKGAPPSPLNLTDDQIHDIAEQFVKEPGWLEFEKSDFISAVHAIIAQARGES